MARASAGGGEAVPDSDDDLAVFLKDLPDPYAEVPRINAITEPILMQTGIEVSALPFQAGSWSDRTRLMHEIRKDGVPL